MQYLAKIEQIICQKKIKCQADFKKTLYRKALTYTTIYLQQKKERIRNSIRSLP